MGKFVIKKSAAGTKFDLKSGNGEIIASSQVYASEAACKKGIESVRKNAASKIENQTKKGFAVETNPKYEVYKDKKGEFRFRLKATNGHIIATSEGYATEANCLKGIESVKKNAPIANIEDQTVEGFKTEKCPKFEIYSDKSGEFRFRLKATNGQIIAIGEGYTTLKNCVNGVESVKKNAPDSPVEEV